MVGKVSNKLVALSIPQLDGGVQRCGEKDRSVEGHGHRSDWFGVSQEHLFTWPCITQHHIDCVDLSIAIRGSQDEILFFFDGGGAYLLPA